MKRTAVEFEQQAAAKGLERWCITTCSICDERMYFHFRNGHVAYYPGCGCVDRGVYEPRTWEDIADFYNCQTAPALIAEMNAFWGWPAPSVTT